MSTRRDERSAFLVLETAPSVFRRAKGNLRRSRVSSTRFCRSVLSPISPLPTENAGIWGNKQDPRPVTFRPGAKDAKRQAARQPGWGDPSRRITPAAGLFVGSPGPLVSRTYIRYSAASFLVDCERPSWVFRHETYERSERAYTEASCAEYAIEEDENLAKMGRTAFLKMDGSVQAWHMQCSSPRHVILSPRKSELGVRGRGEEESLSVPLLRRSFLWFFLGLLHTESADCPRAFCVCSPASICTTCAHLSELSVWLSRHPSTADARAVGNPFVFGSPCSALLPPLPRLNSFPRGSYRVRHTAFRPFFVRFVVFWRAWFLLCFS
ncbi:hypothetical protein MRX96_013939 [Rhipicephalus microplus]